MNKEQEKKLKELIKSQEVKFDFYRANVFYYLVSRLEDNLRVWYRFPVSLEDIGDATLMASDKAILFMRYIRKAIENNELEQLKNKLK